MPKAKSSATAGTRKKHAKRAAGPEAVIPTLQKQKPKEKGKKGSKKEPKQKSYIPPVKPAPVQPDPLETTGLAHRLPPDLLIILRSLTKKATVTKAKALEDLQAGWINKDDEESVSVLVDLLPVWLHHLPALFIHPSRRVRLLTANVHQSLLSISQTKSQILYFFDELASSEQTENILGSWLLVAHDVDRSISASATASWDSFQKSGTSSSKSVGTMTALKSFVQRATLDPAGIYTYLNPPASVQVPLPAHAKRAAVRVPPPMTPDENTRSKDDDQEESEQDRRARIRIGGFGSLRWIIETTNLEEAIPNDLISLLSSPALWSSLHHSAQCPFLDNDEGFGHGQPLVRRAAWTLLQSLLLNWKEKLGPMLPTLSVAILRSAWVEPDLTVLPSMWRPLLMLLKEHPDSWEIDASTPKTLTSIRDNEEDDEDDEDAEAEKLQDGAEEKQDAIPTAVTSTAYSEFLQFLELGCSGAPLHGYPAVVVILSTIPSSIFAATSSPSPLNDLFTSFWAAIDGRALSTLQRPAISSAFLSSLLESQVFMVRRIYRNNGAGEKHAALLIGAATEAETKGKITALLQEQVKRTWDEIVKAKGLKVDSKVAAGLMAKNILALVSIEPELATTGWQTISEGLKASAYSHPGTVSTFLTVFIGLFKDDAGMQSKPKELLKDILNDALERCVRRFTNPPDDNTSEVGAQLLAELLGVFRGQLFSDSEFTQGIDSLLSVHVLSVLSVCPPLLLNYLRYRDETEKILIVWRTLLTQITDIQQLLRLLDAVESGAMPTTLGPQSAELDAVVTKALKGVTEGPSEVVNSNLLRRLLRKSGSFITRDSLKGITNTLVQSLQADVRRSLEDGSVIPDAFSETLSLLLNIDANLLNNLDVAQVLAPSLFLLSFVLPKLWEDSSRHSTFEQSKVLWSRWVTEGSVNDRTIVLEILKRDLREIILSTTMRPTPEDVLEAISDASMASDLGAFDVVPTQKELDAMLFEMSLNVDPSLAVLDSLLPTSSPKQPSLSPVLYDARGWSSYARVTDAILRIFMEDRQIARHNIWSLRHLLMLSLHAQDLIDLPTTSNSIFSIDALQAHNAVQDICSAVQQVTTYLMTSSFTDNEQWRSQTIDGILASKPVISATKLSTLSSFVADMAKSCQDTDSVMETRCLRIVLQHVLPDANKTEGEKWMLLARKLEKTAPWTSIAIVGAIKRVMPDIPRLDRYRNELAADLPTLPISQALLCLTRLCASAPDEDSDILFLPQQRAVNVMKGCQRWITADDDDEEDEVELEPAMTLLFLHLAPILQSVPGSHWDFMFDVIENSLDPENADLTDAGALTTVARTLKLVALIEDLASSNKSLRTDWEERRQNVFSLVRDMASIKLDTSRQSKPLSVCRELILSIVKDLPESLIDIETLPKMCHLLTDSSTEVQTMAYRLLSQAARKRTEHFVIESAVDTEDTFKADIPLELLLLLEQSPAFESGEVYPKSTFGYLLCWMVLFDLFSDASLKVRLSYIDQLRNQSLIAAHLMPILLTILGIDEGPSKAFKLDLWSIDEFYVELLEPQSSEIISFALPVLAAHVYYRALVTVPSVIHSWVLDCKDRQVSTSITKYTSSYFSPTIIQRELTHVRNATDLVTNSMSVKVASAVNEVVASYLVDEHQLEMKLKIPVDWPLHKIEIKDGKKVGVDDRHWRAWTLAVQQTIWAQNGHIVDGLELFKKNLMGHFDGQVECAICYSIISVMDASLPRKPCKTCKNKFHAGCLYKWFNTSHSSSCPLCRSDIV